MNPEIVRLVNEMEERMRAEYERQHPALRLPFDGALSETEQRMLDQETFEHDFH